MRKVLIGTAAAAGLLTTTSAAADTAPAGSNQPANSHCVVDVDTDLTACADGDTTIAEARIAVPGKGIRMLR